MNACAAVFVCLVLASRHAYKAAYDPRCSQFASSLPSFILHLSPIQYMAPLVDEPNVLDDPSRTWAAFDALFDRVFSPRRKHDLPHKESSESLSTVDDTASEDYETAVDSGSLTAQWPTAFETKPKPYTLPPRVDACLTPLSQILPSPDATFKVLEPGMSSMWSPGPSMRRQSLRKRPSKVDFRDSEDNRSVTATFDLPGVAKDDIHISFQPHRLSVTWEIVTTTEKKEVNRMVRERRERKYIRTIPLAEGTKFEDIKATMDGRYLFIVYPKPQAPENKLTVEVAIA